VRSESSTIELLAFASFLFLTASLAIQKPSVLTIAGTNLTATDVLFPLAAIAALFSLIARKRKPVWRTVHWYFAAYVGAFLVASAFSESPTPSLIKTASTAYLVLIAALAIELVDTEEKLRATVLVFLAAAAIPILIGLFTIPLFYLSPGSSLLPSLTYHYGAVPVGNYPRLSSTFVSASMFCNYLNLVLVFLFVAGEKKWIGRRLFIISIAAVLISAAFTISSGLGAVILAAGLWFWFKHPRAALGRLALAGGIFACLLFFATGFIALEKHPTAPYSFQIPLVNVEAYPSPRLLVWTEAANNFLANFLVGSGPGTRSASVLFQNTEGTHSRLTDAHNSFLSVATQTGSLGLAALLALTTYLLVVSCRSEQTTLRFGMGIAFLTAFAIQGLAGSFEDARHLWLLIGLTAAVAKIDGRILPAELGSGS
jgi:hypothetical protein